MSLFIVLLVSFVFVKQEVPYLSMGERHKLIQLFWVMVWVVSLHHHLQVPPRPARLPPGNDNQLTMLVKMIAALVKVKEGGKVSQLRAQVVKVLCIWVVLTKQVSNFGEDLVSFCSCQLYVQFCLLLTFCTQVRLIITAAGSAFLP